MPTLPPRPGPARPSSFAVVAELLTSFTDRLRWIGPLRLLAASIGAIAIVAVAWWSLQPPALPPAPTVDPVPTGFTLVAPEPVPAPSELMVHVAGAVERPGVVTVGPGARVVDAIGAAGGPMADADLDSINLASVLSDGDHVRIPRIGEPPAPGPLHAAPGSPDSPVDINRAGPDELATLPGVGPVTAAAIVADRSERGPFTVVEDLLRVRGIGPSKLEALRDRVRP